MLIYMQIYMCIYTYVCIRIPRCIQVKYCEAMLEEQLGSRSMHLLAREKIAGNFGESLSLRESSHISTPEKKGSFNVTTGAKLVLSILARMKDLEKPVTLLGLTDLWKGNGTHIFFLLFAAAECADMHTCTRTCWFCARVCSFFLSWQFIFTTTHRLLCFDT